jgi:rhodanese-related sulfurtransferase/rubrerythrin
MRAAPFRFWDLLIIFQGDVMILGSFFQRVKSITPDEVRAIIKEKRTDEYCLIDVRQPVEYEQGHVPGAILIPLAELQFNLSKVKSDRMTVVYCRSGNRSRSGVGILNGAGIEDVYNMEGGMNAYYGLVAAGPPEAGVFCFPENMSPEELISMAWYIEDGSLTFLDSIKEKARNQEVEHVLTDLTAHKIDHKKSLFKLYQNISGETAGKDFPTNVLHNPPQNVMAGCVSVPEAVNWSKDKGLPEILELMIALEANTFDLYLKLGRQVESERARSIFMKLSEEESRHLGKLASIFEKTI